ncbi:MAG: rhodanese-like domain-containing protein [Nitriliruptoraceae bacterium]|nr:rhodanese-like domain-containing protein [Nitriliruptoraceae bacterium]
MSLRPLPSLAMLAAAVALVGCAAAAGGSELDPAAGAPDTSDVTPMEVSVETLGPQDAATLLETRDDVVLVDVRTPAEYDAGHLAGAALVDVQASDFDARISEFDRDATIVLYCRSGNRSAVAAARMVELGFVDLIDAGAYDALAAAGVPIS